MEENNRLPNPEVYRHTHSPALTPPIKKNSYSPNWLWAQKSLLRVSTKLYSLDWLLGSILCGSIKINLPLFSILKVQHTLQETHTKLDPILLSLPFILEIKKGIFSIYTHTAVLHKCWLDKATGKDFISNTQDQVRPYMMRKQRRAHWCQFAHSHPELDSQKWTGLLKIQIKVLISFVRN